MSPRRQVLHELGLAIPSFPLHEGARDNSTWLLKSIRLAFGNVRTGLLSVQTAHARSAAVVQSWSERRDVRANPMEATRANTVATLHCRRRRRELPTLPRYRK